MIQTEFKRRGKILTAAQIAGHAGWADQGEDVVCAAVSSAVQLTCNGVTEVLGFPAKVEVGADMVCITLPSQPGQEEAAAFLEALHLHFVLLREDYPNHITITVLEV